MNAQLKSDVPETIEGDLGGPERRCIVTGETGPKSAFVRFVVGPSCEIVPDLRGRLPGRGLWVRARREIIDRAVAKRHFERACRAKIKVSPELGAEVEALLLRHVQDALGLARKAGGVVLGYAKAEALMETGRAIALLEARDAGPHGAAKLGVRARKAGIPIVKVLTGAEMDLALGRENMVHAALGAERLAWRFLDEAGRLVGFRPSSAAAAPKPIPPATPGFDASAPESEENE